MEGAPMARNFVLLRVLIDDTADARARTSVGAQERKCVGTTIIDGYSFIVVNGQKSLQ